MRRRRSNSGYSGNTDQRRSEKGTIPVSKHYIERNINDFASSWIYNPSWVRNEKWLDIPDIPEGEQKFIGLLGITNTSDETNGVAFRFRGAYTVDWGDGSALENFADNAVASHFYSFDSISSETQTDAGLRQVIITVIPQESQNMTTIDLIEVPSGWNTTNHINWLDINIRASNCTSLSISTSSFPFAMLERCRIAQLGNIASLANLFYNCSRLRYIELPQSLPLCTNFSATFRGCTDMQIAPLFDTSKGTNFSNMFNGCNSLRIIPKYDVSSATNLSSMFSSCFSLEYCPAFDAKNNLTCLSMFLSCRSLTEIGLIDTSSCNNFANMFSGCTALKTIPLLDTSAGNIFTSMFATCTSLLEIPLLDTSAGTNFTSMFTSCTSLTEIPLLDTSAGTNFSTMFSACSSLLRISNLDTSQGEVFNSMFNGCTSLRKVDYAMDTSNGTFFRSMFGNCRSLFKIPDISTANVTDNTGMDTNQTSGRMVYLCTNLSSGSFIGLTRAINLLNCKFGQAELVKIFDDLGTAAGSQIINITGNIGAGLLTSAERDIATQKGWTITG